MFAVNMMSVEPIAGSVITNLQVSEELLIASTPAVRTSSRLGARAQFVGTLQVVAYRFGHALQM